MDATNVLEPSYLDRTGDIARTVVAGVRAVNASVPVWAGEIGPHTGNSVGNQSAGDCGGNLLCGRFGSSLWYADSMSSKALAGYVRAEEGGQTKPNTSSNVAQKQHH